MTVTDEAAATLHDLLSRRFDEHSRRLHQLSKSEVDHFTAMINAAFFEAARSRFIKDGKPASDAKVIDYVAYARSWDEGSAEEIDPDAGERLINVVIEKLPLDALDDLDNNVVFNSKLMLLASFVREANYTEEELLAKLIQQARNTAEEMLS
ncbi:hypothetical protein Acsp03_26490 [Actinomadura sp. NBRC 104412]|nr:hypothetical protein Acsp03_26490 [Actinomadura sp. NBRC 104412]